MPPPSSGASELVLFFIFFLLFDKFIDNSDYMRYRKISGTVINTVYRQACEAAKKEFEPTEENYYEYTTNDNTVWNPYYVLTRRLMA
jgi:uncharacterized sporulation protein YeaH/YhbH (DUF444 family)